MKQFLGIEDDHLKEINSYWTAREIAQQPTVWAETAKMVEDQRDKLDDWLLPVLKIDGLQIILTGAGTSSFLGETLAPWLRTKMANRVDSVSTTDIVGHPEECFANRSMSTLLVSFARSGDSPESVASVELADQFLDNVYHLVVTCNSAGQLAKLSAKSDNAFCLLMPERTNDVSFAMTSSFTSMLVACATVFCPDAKKLQVAISAVERILTDDLELIKSIASLSIDRLVFLGSGSLNGTAQEAALKCLELTAGKIVSYSNTPLGFRHGPKFVINTETMVFVMESSSPYSKKYDGDLLNEITVDGCARKIVTLSAEKFGLEDGMLGDLWLSLPCIVFCQIFALQSAMRLNVPGDNPSPTGEVNRVVSGVKIYGYH